jgi:hypothetical protein
MLWPLTDALQGPGSKKSKLLWAAEMFSAFQQIKQQLCAAATLVHQDPAARISLAVDASDSHVGAVLQQLEKQEWWPLTFYSKKLDATQRRYSAFNRELLAAYLAIHHFRYSLEGRCFMRITSRSHMC